MIILDFIYTGSADLLWAGKERKIQNENICLPQDSNPRHSYPRQESRRFRPLGHAG